MKFLSQDGLAYLWTKIQAKLDALASRITTDETAIAGKVDKVEGKGLSTEDYTTAEKAKLAGVEAGANAYTLPAATSGALGGVKQGANVSIAADGTLSATDTTYGEATTGSAGLMSVADKTKLNGIAEGANNYSLPAASSTVLGGIRLGSGLEYNSVTGQTDVATYDPASQSAAGLMSAADKTKLDGIESGANAYSLPTATDRVRGGVIMDFFINQNSDNPLANSGVYAALDTKVDKVDGKDLSSNDYTTAEKNKLAGIAANATAVTVDNFLNQNSWNPLANAAIFNEVDAITRTIQIGPLTVWTDHFAGDADKNFYASDYYGNAIIHLERTGTTGSQLQSVNIASLPNGLEWAETKTVSVKASDGNTYNLYMEQGHSSINLRLNGTATFLANFSFSYTGLVSVTY